MNKITLIGPTGSTGRLVAKRLADAGLPFRLAGRNAARLDEIAAELGIGQLEKLQLDVTRAHQVANAVSGTSVVINCAGPFTDIGLLVLKACAGSGVDYLDTTGEQDFVRRAVEDFSETARDNGCALVPSCAFEYAFGDAAAALLSEHMGGLDEFEVTYMFNGISTSRGTRKSVLRALGSPALQLVDGKLVRLKAGHVEAFKIENSLEAASKSGKGTETLSRFPFPGGEVCLVPLHTRVRTVKTNLASPTPAPILSIMSQVGPMVARSPLRSLLDGLIDMTSSKLTNPEKTTFRILCSGKRGEQSAKLEISGNDPYGLTAVIAAAVAKALHERKDKNPVGTVSASMVKGAQFIKEITEANGVVWTNP